MFCSADGPRITGPSATTMRLTLHQSGGFAGIARPPLTLETGALAAAQRTAIERLVHAAGLGAAAPAAKPTMPDRFQYRLEVRHDDGTTAVVGFAEDTATPAQLKLVRLLRAAPAAKPPAKRKPGPRARP